MSEQNACPSCSCPAPADAAFCAFCGTKLVELEVAKAAVVPDVVGEIVGWRTWRIDLYGRMPILRSVTHNSIWKPGEWMEAECDRRSGHPPSEIPHERCSCGLYAAKTREHLFELGYPSHGVVLGEVAFAGKVIPGTQGWRAQKGRVLRLYLPYESWKWGEKLSRLYHCETRLDHVKDVRGTALDASIDPVALRARRRQTASEEE